MTTTQLVLMQFFKGASESGVTLDDPPHITLLGVGS